jgi:PTH1 family peptidyl-tRNA hydrolase
MKLIVGLGNVGKNYQNTRHNLGFGVIDMLAITFGCRPEDFKKHSKAPAEVLDLKESQGCMLVKPTTMMNLSGQAVGELARYYKIAAEDIWVIYDDVDLRFGQLRVRQGGPTGGGHNGVKSVISHIGENFWRVRLGIWNHYIKNTPTDKFVLDPFMGDETDKVPIILRKTADYLVDALIDGLADHTQNLLE